MIRSGRWVGGLVLAMGVLTIAERRAPAQSADVAVPILVFGDDDREESDEQAGDEELDLANLVTSAAKGVSTVQEAPAIVTILPAQELHESQARSLGEVIDRIPGFLRFEAFNGEFSQALARGVMQAVLQLQDGVSLFDPQGNTMSTTGGIPMEMMKRIEIISGPGGVLWGANSFLGVINVITKDAEDIDGVEANLSYADGKGDRTHARAYVLAGLPHLFGREDWGLVVHTSFESMIGPIYTRSGQLFSQPLPNPNSIYYYGPIADTDPARSWIFNFDGKLSLGALVLQWSLPFEDRYEGMGLNGAFAINHLPEYDLPECQGADPASTSDHCYDPARATRVARLNFFRRYGLAEYKWRFSEDAGGSVKAYFIHFANHFDPLVVLRPTPGLVEGGLSFVVHADTFRAGGSYDGDVQVNDWLRVLYGAEAFHEWFADNTDGSREGAGTQSDFYSPYNLAQLPFACPLQGAWDPALQKPVDVSFVDGCPVTVVFEVNRTTLGGFTALQVRPSSRLVLDGGVRLQVAPELAAHSRGYGLTPTFSAAAVYELVRNWHVKVNYAEGFRPPVFNNTDANGESVNIGGSPDLKVETSRSGQGEINARVFQGQRSIRELDLRADYSYTVLDNYISFIGGRYANTGRRGIHSAELLGKLYLKGGHRFELGYTFNAIEMSDKGAFHAMPNNWLSLGAVQQIIPEQLELSTVLRVYGAFEDPNRRIEARGLVADPMTGASTPTNPDQAVGAKADEAVIDRIAPAAEVQVGARLHAPDDRWQLQATLYNAFNNERNSYDNSNDLEPRLEVVPSTFEAFRFFVSATYRY
jgi:outer membrane receptor protein involved in Fe transport